MPARIAHRHRFRPHLLRGVAVLALGLGTLTACGGSDDPDDSAATTTSAASSSGTSSSPGGSASQSVSSEAESITATEADFSISLDEDSLPAGSYEIEVVNNGSSTHDLAVEQDGNKIAASDSIGPGDTTTLTVELAPGEYVFYCSIGNHRAMGMEITVEVT